MLCPQCRREIDSCICGSWRPIPGKLMEEMNGAAPPPRPHSFACETSSGGPCTCPAPPPRSTDEQLLAEKLKNLRLRDKLAAKDAEIERLRKIIEDAPHGFRCDSEAQADGHDTGRLCDCWKSEAKP